MRRSLMIAKTLKVNLTYFKQSGKYYTEGCFHVEHMALYNIWKIVKMKQQKGLLPGIIEGGGKYFTILVNVPSHEHAHPILFTPLEREIGGLL